MSPAVRKPPTAPTAAGAAFGDLDFYGGSFTIPEGDYALEFNVQMHQGTNQQGQPLGAERLGVMVNFYPLKGGDPMEKFLSMGSKAHESWAPNAETGKGIVAVAGGSGAKPPTSTNWGLFLKSLYDTGLPKGVFIDDISVLDGIHAHVQSVPEPEERKGFGGAKTGEAGEQERKGPSLIPIVTEIKEDGKPWEGTGGIPAPSSAPTKPAAAAAVKPGPRAVAAPKPAAAAPAAAADADELRAAAINAVTAVLTEEKNVNGCSKLALRTGSFKAATSAVGEATASAVINAFFATDDALNGLLGELGYKVEGGSVKLA